MAEIQKDCLHCKLFVPDLGQKAIQAVIDRNYINAYIAGRDGLPLPTEWATFSGSRRCSLNIIDVFDSTACGSITEFQGREQMPLLTCVQLPLYFAKMDITEPSVKKIARKIRKEIDSGK